MAEYNKNMSPEEEDRMIEEAYQDVLNAYLASNHRKKWRLSNVRSALPNPHTRG